MRFKSLEQAYFLYNYKRVVFRQLSAEGVPFLWHEYKKLRDGGMDAKTAEKAVHDPRIEKWQDVLKIRENSLTLQRRRRYSKSKSIQQDTATVGGSCCESIRHKLIGMVQEWEEDWLYMKFSEDYANMNCEELMDALKDLEDALRPERPNLSVDISDLIDEWIECEEDGN
tara:strand:- start:233 stop:742 length:510 start_codon:yes stop_codon:yes gene_type:complete